MISQFLTREGLEGMLDGDGVSLEAKDVTQDLFEADWKQN